MMASSLPPMVASPTRTTVFSGRRSSVINLYGLVTRMTSATPGRFSKRRAVDRASVAGDANGCSRGTGHRMRTQPNFLNHVYNCVHFLRSSAGFHYNQHMVSLGLFSLVQTPNLSLERREKISVPLKNGRSLSPRHERQREGERPSKVCRIKNVDAHRQKQ